MEDSECPENYYKHRRSRRTKKPKVKAPLRMTISDFDSFQKSIIEQIAAITLQLTETSDRSKSLESRFEGLSEQFTESTTQQEDSDRMEKVETYNKKMLRNQIVLAKRHKQQRERIENVETLLSDNTKLLNDLQESVSEVGDLTASEESVYMLKTLNLVPHRPI